MASFETSANLTDMVLTKDGLSVTLHVVSEEENLTKNIINIGIPNTNPESDVGNPNYAKYRNKIIDILSKVEQRLTIIGFLDSTTAGLTAEQKRSRLRNMFLAGSTDSDGDGVKDGGLVTITTFNGTFDGRTADLDKIQFKRLPTDNIIGDGVAEIEVTLSLIFGDAFGSAT